MLPLPSCSLANEGNQIFIQPDGSQNKHRCANIGLLILAPRHDRDTGRADNMAADAHATAVRIKHWLKRKETKVSYSILFYSIIQYYIPVYSV